MRGHSGGLESDTSLHLSTSDGGHRISMRGQRRAHQNFSKLSLFFLCALSGLSSIGQTYLSKRIMREHEELSPLVLLMIQCLVNVLVCMSLMTIKEVDKTSLTALKNVGLVIPELNKVADKVRFGIPIGFANVITALMCLYALKLNPLPL